jgi:eukaryotic-like serine/threonine-protein kinase
MTNARTAGPRMPSGYRYLRHLGAGGFGDVHLAEHVGSGRLAAIKHIQPHLLSDPDTMARFVREARILASTDVPSVVRVYDLDTTGDPAYLAMEYVPGVTLWDLMEVAPLPPRQALPILRDVSEALRVMGLRGLVHRDIKPSNVFVLPSGHAKLGDFGLARPMEADGGFRTTGAPAGTPAYFPPEVSQGHADSNLESDAYSFAVMVYEVLAGARPINAPDAISLITAHWTQPPTPVTSVMPDFPPGPAELLMRALAKHPAGRPLPHELMAALDAVPPGYWSTNARPDVQVPGTPPVDDAYEAVAGAVTGGIDDLGAHTGAAPTTVALADGPVASSAPATIAVPPSLPSRTIPVETRIPPVPDGRRRGWWLGAGILAALAIVVGIAGWRLLGQDEEPAPSAEPIEVLTVTAAADPTAARCPRAKVVVVASIGTNGRAGSVAVSWTLVDGTSGPRQVFSVGEGQREVNARLEIALSGSRPMSGQVGVMVEPTGLGTTAPVTYRCPQPPR